MLALVPLAACQAFNDECTLVSNPDAPVVTLQGEVFLDRPNARHDNNALGQGAADAFADAMRADFGVLNSGALRSEGLCGVTRNVVTGVVTDQVLHEILLFENTIVATDLDGLEVKAMFEHSVEQLFAAGQPIVSPSGQFMQVSKAVKLTVDCSRAKGDRITLLTVNGQLVMTSDTVKTYRVAMSSFVLGGGDGYTVPRRNVEQAQRLGGIDSNITSEYLKTAYAGKTLAKEPRITFVGCATPARPP